MSTLQPRCDTQPPSRGSSTSTTGGRRSTLRPMAPSRTRGRPRWRALARTWWVPSEACAGMVTTSDALAGSQGAVGWDRSRGELHLDPPVRSVAVAVTVTFRASGSHRSARQAEREPGLDGRVVDVAGGDGKVPRRILDPRVQVVVALHARDVPARTRHRTPARRPGRACRLASHILVAGWRPCTRCAP